MAEIPGKLGRGNWTVALFVDDKATVQASKALGQGGLVAALATLVASHLAVQLVKRTVVRARPGESGVHAPVVAEPDRFSFPSGHAAASMSVALGYGEPFFASAQAEIDARARLLFSQGTRVWPGGLGSDGPLIGAAAVGFGYGS